MGLGSFLKKAATAPLKLAAQPVKKTVSSSKKLFKGDVKGAAKSIGPVAAAKDTVKANPVKQGLAAFRGYQAGKKPKSAGATSDMGSKDMAQGEAVSKRMPGGLSVPKVGQAAGGFAGGEAWRKLKGQPLF